MWPFTPKQVGKRPRTSRSIRNSENVDGSDTFQSAAAIETYLEAFFAYTDETSHFARVPAVRACVDRIVSRAMFARYKTESKSMQGRIDRPNSRSHPQEFYRQMLEELLLTGNAFVWRDASNNRHVALTTGTQYDPVRQRWSVQINTEGRKEFFPVGDDRLMHATLGYYRGASPQKAPSPLAACAEAIKLYAAMRGASLDYLNSGLSVSAVFQGRVEHMNKPEKLAETAEDVEKAVQQIKHRYAQVYSPPEAELKRLADPKEPAPSVGQFALQEIARVFGVPLDLLQTDQKRQEDAVIDAHLLRDAVYPVCSRIAAAWTRHTHTLVDVDKSSLMLPAGGSTAKAILTMGQIGCFTKNEIRAMSGYEPLPEGMGGDELTQSAGAPGREEGGADQGSKNKDDAE